MMFYGEREHTKPFAIANTFRIFITWLRLENGTKTLVSREITNRRMIFHRHEFTTATECIFRSRIVVLLTKWCRW